jgi:hypothetical protein
MTGIVNAAGLEVEIRRLDVLHFLGYRGRGLPSARVAQMLTEVVEQGRSLMAPRGIDREVRPDQISDLGLTPVPRATLSLGLVTIGPELERQVTDLLSGGETTRALLLDAVGSAAVEEAADVLEGRLRGATLTGTGHASGASRRFSPGYGRWPLSAQRPLFDLLPHDDIQVRLLPSGLMTPRKSVSFAIWLGPGGDPDAPAECRSRRCADCDMETCLYREPDPS